jgi:hypothetical protein
MKRIGMLLVNLALTKKLSKGKKITETIRLHLTRV